MTAGWGNGGDGGGTAGGRYPVSMDGWFSAAGWMLALAGVGVGLWACLWDRAGWRGRARLRCRRCWHDLTGTPMVDRASVEHPATCPECGREHRSRRAMRRTRRRWWGLAGALGLLVLGHAAAVAPAVRARGWVAAVPRVALVGWLPFMSEEQGTGISWVIGSAKTPTRFDAAVLAELGVQYWPMGQEEDRLGWLSRRAAFLLARAEPVAVITDGTTAKGRAYKSVITRVVRSGHAYGFEEAWAHSVAHIEVRADPEHAPDAVIYGGFSVRRLLLGGYTLRVGWRDAEFACWTPNSMRLNGPMPSGTPAEVERHWIERFLWDTHHRDGFFSGLDPWPVGPGVGLGVASAVQGGPTVARVRFGIFENRAGQRETERWELVAALQRELPYTLDPALAPIRDASARLRDELEGSLKARIGVVWDRDGARWIPVLTIHRRGGSGLLADDEASGSGPGERVLIGGRVEVCARWDFGSNPYTKILMTTDDCWWLVEDRTEGYDGRLAARSVGSDVYPGALEHRGYTLGSRYEDHGRVLVRFNPGVGRGFHDFGGFEAGTVFEGPLELRVEHWTHAEIVQLIVNGTVPDHALPP